MTYPTHAEIHAALQRGLEPGERDGAAMEVCRIMVRDEHLKQMVAGMVARLRRDGQSLGAIVLSCVAFGIQLGIYIGEARSSKREPTQ